MRSPVSLTRLVAVSAAVTLVACGGSPRGPVPGPTLTVGPVPAVLSNDLAVGNNRFVFAMLDGRTGRPVSRPDDRIGVRLYDLASSETVPAAEGEGRFLWVEPEREGAFVVPVRFETAGAWEAELVRDGARPARVGFTVKEEPATPRVGAKAPASFTRTLRDVGGDLAQLTTDPRPARRFYRTSILQAVRSAVPFVVVFASPRHCSSSGCGHMLTVAKRVAAGTSDLTFIHVELYRDAAMPVPQLLDPAVGEWGLPSEPWLFVVGAAGRVTAKFERAVTEDELRAAVEALY